MRCAKSRCPGLSQRGRRGEESPENGAVRQGQLPSFPLGNERRGPPSSDREPLLYFYYGIAAAADKEVKRFSRVERTPAVLSVLPGKPARFPKKPEGLDESEDKCFAYGDTCRTVQI